jgi:putative oxidoreductase
MATRSLNPWQGWGITVLRLVVGIVFLMHGGQKLFVWGFGGVAAFLGRLGIPAPGLAAPIVTLVEFLGGLALVLGLYTRYAAALLAVDMLVAIVTYHLPHGFFAPKGVEYPLTLLAANLALVLLGPGEASVDGLRQGRQG